MRNTLRTIFVDANDRLRAGWRVPLFLIVFNLLFSALAFPLVLLHAATDSTLRLMGLLAVLGCSALLTRYINRKPLAAIGLGLDQAAIRNLARGCVLGFLMISSIFAAELSLGWVTLQWKGLGALECLLVLTSAFGYFFLTASFEETLFRGYVFQSLIQAVTFLPAALSMAAFFAFAHRANPNVGLLSYLNIGLAGIWLSIAYIKTRTLWLPIGLHFAWNFTQTTLYAFPTSGVKLAQRSLCTNLQTGPEWLTGGSFGPEGGALATVALIAGTWYIIQSRAISAQEGVVTLDSPDPNPHEKRAAPPATGD